MENQKQQNEALIGGSELNAGLGWQVIKKEYNALPKPLRFVLTGIAQLIAIAASFVLSPVILVVAVIGILYMSIGEAYESFK